jgi:hypothetical protein
MKEKIEVGNAANTPIPTDDAVNTDGIIVNETERLLDDSAEPMSDAEEDAMWVTLNKSPEALISLPNATAEMQAFALRRRAYLIFQPISWRIDTEYICPGITAWKSHYQKRHDNPAIAKQPARAIPLLIEMVSTFERARKLAFMPPEKLGANIREQWLRLPYLQSEKSMERVALKHFGKGPYPENDVKARKTETVGA